MEISIYSKEAVEELIDSNFPQNTAVISFYDPPIARAERAMPVDYNGKAKMLFQVAVNDIDIDVLEDYGLTFDTYFTEAEELAEFILEAYKSELNIICQCEYGQSRSAGCAAAICEYFQKDGIKIFRDYRYYPNQLIFNKVYDALRKVGKLSCIQKLQKN